MLQHTISQEEYQNNAIRPAVVFDALGCEVDAHLLEGIFTTFELLDDVFDRAFTIGAIFYAKNAAPTIGARSASLQQYLDQKSSELILNEDALSSLPSGPYILQGDQFHQAWRLFPDVLGSFVTSMVPDDSDDNYKLVQPSAFSTSLSY